MRTATLAGVLASTLAGTLVACATTITPLPRTQASAPAEIPATTAPQPERHTTGRTTSLARTIDALLDQPSFRTASWGILIVDPRGDTVYARNAAKLMTPASNMKVITTAVALAQLGPDFHFRDSAAALPLRDTVPSDFGPMYDTAFVRTASLRDVLPKLLKPSQNQLAEQLFYTLALERTGVIARDSAAATERRQLAAWGVPSDGYILHDGSGYDRADFLSPETLVHVLATIQRDTAFAIFYNALPVAGIDGTLAHRMRATTAERNAHAKTGSLGAVRALSGYVTTADGTPLIFSMICNGFTTVPETVTGVMDRIVTQLATLSRAELTTP